MAKKIEQSIIHYCKECKYSYDERNFMYKCKKLVNDGYYNHSVKCDKFIKQ